MLLPGLAYFFPRKRHMVNVMSAYSDFVMAVGMHGEISADNIDEQTQVVFEQTQLSLIARTLYLLIASQPGEAVNPFADLRQPAEVIHSAVEELIAAELIVRV